MEQVTIRPIQPTDNPVIAKIIRDVLTEFKANKPGTVYYDPTTDDLFKLFQTADSAYYILELNGKIMGGAGVFPTENLPAGCCELVKIYLLPEARGKGLGKRLIEHCFETGKRLGYQQMYLETLHELSNAMALYEKMGFSYIQAPLGNSGHGGCDLWMLKSL